MKGRFWALASLTSIALAGGVYVARHTGDLQSSGKHVVERLAHVDVQAIANRSGPAATAPLIRQQTRNLSNALGATPEVTAPSEPAIAPAVAAVPASPTVRCGDLVRKLKHSLSLSAQEEGQVQGVFKTASAIQAGIDAEASAANRRLYQEQLIQQVALRLKLILKDEQRIEFARAELQGLPRLEQGG